MTDLKLKLISMNKLNVLITGATSGIGEACAFKFGENNHNLILTGRRIEKLKKLADELQSKFKVDVNILNFDVRNREECLHAISTLPEGHKRIDILINNAGLALGIAPINEGNPEDWDTMIDTNVKGILNVSQAVMPGMIERMSGHIINVGSIAGKETYLNGNVYCASKAAVDSLTKAMRIDLLKYGIKVTHVAPGAAETEFSIVRFKGNTEAATKVYEGFQPLSGKDIADVIYFSATLPPHVNLNDVVIVPTAQANTTYLHRG
jgi:NADP-dependent 3-hydroxy acid dehydrogenase YdfG